MSAASDSNGVTVVLQADYADACENYRGWCPACNAFTTDSVEPDATGYDCEACDESAVLGAEEALLCGVIIIAAT